MLSKKKIWTIPIAALALTLMLAAAMAVSGIAQAQTPPDRDFGATTPGFGAYAMVDNTKDEVTIVVSGALVADATTGLVTIGLDTPPTDVAVTADADGDTTTTTEDDGYRLSGADASMFDVSSTGVITVDATGVTAIMTGPRAVFNFDVNVYVDEDITDDSGNGVTIASVQDREGDETPARATDNADDRDEMHTLSVTVYAMKLDTVATTASPAQFATTVGDVADVPLLGLRSDGNGYSKGIGINGLPPDATITLSDSGASGVYDPELDDNNVVWIKPAPGGAPAVGTNEVYSVILTVDPDGAGADTTAIALTANIVVKVFAVLDFPIDGDTDGDGVVDDGEAHGIYSFSVQSNAPKGTVIGEIPILGAFADIPATDLGEAEVIDTIVTGSSDFMARPRLGANDAVVAAVIEVAKDGGLTTGMQELMVTANGRLSPRRTAETKANVMVTVSNNAPTKIDSALTDGAAVLVIPETDKDIEATSNGLLEDGETLPGGDFSAYATDNNPLKYSIKKDADEMLPFKFVGSKLVPEGDIAVTITAAQSENITTTDVDETKTVYTAPEGGKFSDGMSMTNTPNLDVMYEFTVLVQDSANTLELPVKLTIDVNMPVMVDVNPATNVMSGMFDHDGDEVDGYTLDIMTSERDVPQTLFNLGALFDDPDSDELEFEVKSSASHIVHDDQSGNLLLTYLPPDSDPNNANMPGPREDVLTITATDEYNDGPDADAVLYLKVTVTKKPPTPTQTAFVDITVAENSTDCMIGTTAGCSLMGLIVPGDNGTPDDLTDDEPAIKGYTIENGNLDAQDAAGDVTDYAVDAATGMISVVNAPDFEKGKSPAFLVNVINVDDEIAGTISVTVMITDVNEMPEFTNDDTMLHVYENAQAGDPVMTGKDPADPQFMAKAEDQDAGHAAALVYSITGKSASLFNINSSTGALTVARTGSLDFDDVANRSHSITVVATDPGGEKAELPVTISIENSNENPNFTAPVGNRTKRNNIPESWTHSDGMIFTFVAEDKDGNDLNFSLREGVSQELFSIENVRKTSTANATTSVWQGELFVKQGVTLDYESDDYSTEAGHRVHVEVQDEELGDTLLLEIFLVNVNDKAPKFGAISGAICNADTNKSDNVAFNCDDHVAENTARGTVLASFPATDEDGQKVTYKLLGKDARSFHIDSHGNLKTLEALDADRMVPCGTDGCSVTVEARDDMDETLHNNGAPRLSVTANVRITVTPIEDSLSTLHVSKANPVPGTSMGNPMSANAGTKVGGDEYLWNMLDCPAMEALVGSTDGSFCKMWNGLDQTQKNRVSGEFAKNADERPDNLPATYGSAPMNFVETDWGNWDTLLRIEITAESPAAAEGINAPVGACGNGNQCVVVHLASDSADDELSVKAYRSATQDNKYVAAVKLVETSNEATPGDAPVGMHTDGSVPAIRVDEEDKVEIKFGNLRASVDVENEMPEVDNFAPDHETAFDDEDVKYTFTITDDQSGLPEPEDLPDGDGDDEYMPVVALISEKQCHVSNTGAPKDDKGNVIADLSMAAHIHGDDSLYCPGTQQDVEGGEYIAGGGGWGFFAIRDDKDFDSVDNGYDVDTTIVLTENDIYYVTFIVCDNAGNCAYYDPDGNDDAAELAEVTVDTEDPVFVEARTGIVWDSGDNEYDDDKNFIQVIFNDLTSLNVDTVESDDFVVAGHSIVDVHVFENPDDEDVDWADSGRFGVTGDNNKRGIARYRDLENAVFLELEDELLADETPDVAVVPNGVEDAAGNEQDDGEYEADDWIAPSFTIVSMVSTRETAQDEILAGDDDEVTVTVTADERLDATRPTVTVTYVNAPAGSVDTKGRDACTGNDGTRSRGEIVHNGNCADNSAATGGTLNNTIEKITNQEWIITITEPKSTGYYNFHIAGKDRSPQENPGSEGVSPSKIVVDFFDADGDVNVEDAYFFEGDLNLPKPMVRVSGVNVTDNEADVEFRSPLFVELDFTRNHSDNCGASKDDDFKDANCRNENSEYAEDNFDDIVVTSFVLDGVDLTDSVKTTDDQTFLVSLESVAFGDHTAEVQAMDQAGNIFEDTLEIDFEVNERDPFEKRLNPGWNLVSLPGEPADSSIASVLDASVEVRTVYTYNPVVPGGWLVAVRETLDSEWQGDLTEITGQRGYWILSDAIQDWEVSIPRLAGGAVGAGTPIQPPVIALYAGWNLIPVTDVKGNALDAGTALDAAVYLQSLEDGIEAARVLGFDTIRNEWYTVLDGDMMSPGMGTNLLIGSGYWVFVRNATALVPGGVPGVGSSD